MSEDSSSYETNPLLDDVDHVSPNVTPLPKAQLATLFLNKLVVPVSQTQSPPYISALILKYGFTQKPARVGYYTGIIGTVPPIAKILSTYAWGRLSDGLGRKPVVLAGVLGLGLATFFFGFTKTLAGIIILQFAAGVFTATVPAMHSIVGELTDATNRPFAFPYYDLVNAAGYVIGPLIGGTFADPAATWPSTFDTEFFRVYPYALPCLVTAALAAFAFFVGLTLLKETLPRKSEPSERNNFQPSSNFAAETGAEAVATGTLPSFTQLLAYAPLRAVLGASFAMTLFASFFNGVLVLFCFTPTEQGGLSFTPSQIGKTMAIMGSISAFLKGIVLPLLLRRYKITLIYLVCMRTWPFAFIAFPLLNLIARSSAGHGFLLWAGVTVTVFLSRIGCLSFSITMILIRETAPSLEALGGANGLEEMTEGLASLLAPPLISALFAASVDNMLLGGNLWVVVAVLMSLSGGWFVHQIERQRAWIAVVRLEDRND